MTRMPEQSLKYIIPLPPVSKKNSQRILRNRNTGAAFISPSAQYKTYERKAVRMLRPRPEKPICTPVEVRCLFYMPTRRPVDKSNLEEAIHDVLVKSGVLADDCRDIVASTDGSRVYWDKENPRTEVTITPLKETYEVWRKREE